MPRGNHHHHRTLLLLVLVAFSLLATASAAEAATYASRYANDAYGYSHDPWTVNDQCGTGWRAVEFSFGGNADQWDWRTCWFERPNTFSQTRTTYTYLTSNAVFSYWGWQHNPGATAFWCGRLRGNSTLAILSVRRWWNGAANNDRVVSVSVSCK